MSDKQPGVKILNLSLYPDPHRELTRSDSELRRILHPSLVEIHSVVFVSSCWKTNKLTDAHVWKCNLHLKKCSFYICKGSGRQKVQTDGITCCWFVIYTELILLNLRVLFPGDRNNLAPHSLLEESKVNNISQEIYLNTDMKLLFS